MKSNILRPKVVAGGLAVPLGKNFYYMTGKKHKDGGIDIGENPKTGIEVEDGEVMHLTNNEVKVFSSVPFLNGQSPAQKVMKGDNATKVFNDQEDYKDDKGINDDGTKKKNGGKVRMKSNDPLNSSPSNYTNKVLSANTNSQFINKLYKPNTPTSDLKGLDGTVSKRNRYNMKAKYGKRVKYDDGGNINAKRIADVINGNKTLSDVNNSLLSGDNSSPDSSPDPNNNTQNGVQKAISGVGNFINKNVNSVGKYYNDNPGSLSDTVGLASNVVGSIISNKANNDMLNKLKYSPQPIARQPTKLKTTININPQLDKMRESAASYERDINNNTASSRVALARKQQGRVANMLQTNELYGSKENIETQLTNEDKLNQQKVADANLGDYNQWARGKADFNNAIAEKKSENKVSLIDNLNTGVQDIISRNEKRDATKNNMLTMAAAHPDVNPMILRQLGVTSITDKMIEDWNAINSKKTRKTNN